MKEMLTFAPGAEGFASKFCAPRVRFAPHHHEELEVNLILSGRASYLVGIEQVQLVAGSMIWLFPKQEHVLMDCSPDFTMWILVFKPALVERYAQQRTREVLRSADPGTVFCRQLDGGTVDSLTAVYENAAEEDIEVSNAALAYGLVASWQALQFSREAVGLVDVHPAIAKAVRLISEAEGVMPLPELARRAGLSASRLSRLFKKQTGISITAFRQRKCL